MKNKISCRWFANLLMAIAALGLSLSLVSIARAQSTTDGAIGVLATGTLDTARLTSLLRHLPAGTWELVTHPGYNDIDLSQAHTRLLESREIELQALRALKQLQDIDLISFADL